LFRCFGGLGDVGLFRCFGGLGDVGLLRSVAGRLGRGCLLGTHLGFLRVLFGPGFGRATCSVPGRGLSLGRLAGGGLLAGRVRLGRRGLLVRPGPGLVGGGDVARLGARPVSVDLLSRRGRLAGLSPGLLARPPRIENQPANRAYEGDEAHPDVPANAEQPRRGVDPQRLDPRASHGVAGDVVREQAAGAAVGVVLFPQHQSAGERQVPQSLVEERRMERGHVEVARRSVRRIDLQAPGQVGGPTEQFLVEPVAQPPDRLGDGQRRGDDVQQLGHR
jgi:hypothetical protein